jgi:superfamily I DNA/RNA helicase
LSVLRKVSPDDIDSVGIPLLAEAIRRMRTGEVIASAGYDGEYGRITVFSETDRQRLMGQQMLFSPDAVCAEEKPCRPLSSQLQSERPDQTGCADTGADTAEEDQAGRKRAQFNSEQQQAVTAANGAMLIVAGPGSGKTRTLTARVGHLMMERDIGADRILAVTFTNKAAAEMRHRLQRLLSDDQALPLVATFHGLCHRLLKEHRPGEVFYIIDDKDRFFWMSEAIQAIVQTGQAVPFKPGQLIERIARYKQQMMGPDDIIRADTYRADNGIISLVYREYQKLLASQRLSDYDDLIREVVRLLEFDPDFRKACRARFCHIFIDEYQDVNFAQYRLVRALSPTVGKDQNLCVIGDPDQAIYGFRGSDVHFFNQFSQDYPGALKIRLKRNYRSTRTILEASHHVIRASRTRPEDSRMASDIEGIKTITLLECASDRIEAEKIARTIESLIGGTGFHSVDTGMIEDANLAACRNYTDFAVLFRTHEQGRVIARIFENAGIPCQRTSRNHMLDQDEAGSLLAAMRLVEATGSFAEFDQTAAKLMPGLGKKAIRSFSQWCRHNGMTVNEGLQQVGRIPIPGLKKSLQLRLTDFSQEIETIRTKIEHETIFRKLTVLSERIGISDFFSPESKAPHARDYIGELADRYADDIDGFFTAVALDTDTDIYSEKAQKVPLMTLHAAKGLEFPVVFIAGCEDQFLPFQRTGREASDLEEERRLFYVGMTRARQRLYLSWAKRRRIYGKIEDRRPSSFLADIENRLLACERSGKITAKKKASNQKQMDLF